MHGLTKQRRAGNRTDIAALLIALDHHHIRVSGAGRRTKVPEERTRGPQVVSYGVFGCPAIRMAVSRPLEGVRHGPDG